MSAPTDTHEPIGRWEFDAEVAAVFDDMLSRSIPQYEVMRSSVRDLGRAFLGDGGTVIDLGSSRGEGVASLVDEFRNRNRFVLNEVSNPMAEALQQRFASEIESKAVFIDRTDIRYGFPHYRAAAILTIQFTPINYRQRIIQNVYDALEPKGGFIFVEKLLGRSDPIDRLMVYRYHALKHEHGYEYDSIDRKASSLEGVLVPVTAEWNESLLETAGFRYYDCFWRWMNFAGWVAIK